MMRFALVVLVACSPSKTPRDQTPPRPPPIDAAIDAPVDAPVDAAVAVDASVVDVLRVRCRDVNGPSMRFPKCLAPKEAPNKREPIVLAIKRRGAATDGRIPIVVKGGTNRGIDESWRALLLDAKKRSISHSGFVYTRLDPDEIEGLVTLHPEIVESAKSVRFTAPESPASDIAPFAVVIERVEVRDKDVVIVVGVGTRDGIAKNWRAELVDETTRALPNGRLTVTRLDVDALEGTVKLTQDQAERAKGVRFTPR